MGSGKWEVGKEDSSRFAHFLDFRFPVPGASRVEAELWRLEWAGAAVMGIVNVTPDSFSDGGKYASTEAAIARARKLLDDGALFLDVGGESTRPGAQPVSEDEELSRVLPVVREAARGGRGIVSVDTMKPGVARAALSAGAHLVNDVGGLRDCAMVRVCAEFGAPAVVMHMQGEPRTMQQNPVYDDVAGEVFGFLRGQAALALAAGVPSVVLDPGLGFGKTLAHNLTLLRELPTLTAEPHPVLIGVSRKRLIDYLADVPVAANRDPGSIALHLRAAELGASIVRAHDVAGHVQALRVWEKISP